MPKHINNTKALLIFDPPYVCTAQGAYALDNYFGMVDFLNVMRFVRPPFLFFSSTKSEFLAYLEFIKQHKPLEFAQLAGYQSITQTMFINNKVNYEDNFIYKFNI